jgi:transcriptional regulator with XRE-family HTH domain
VYGFGVTGLSGVSSLLAALVRVRVASGCVSGAALASVVGVSQCHLSNWLCGRKRVSVRVCDAVMCELGLGVEDVLRSAAPALRVAPARGVLLVMPGPRVHRSAWRRRVDPARIAADFGEAS